MQKSANRILSMLLALVMVLAMLPATVFATGETDVLEGWNITLGEDVGVKFHLNSADYNVSATVNGVAVEPAVSGDTVTVNVAAAQMTDTIGLTVKNGEETVHSGEYSVRAYAETILEGAYDDYVKAMVKQMLNYGAAAQTYFNYHTGSLANAGYELEPAAQIPTEIPGISSEGTLEGIALYGMSLLFRSKTAVRFYFTVSGDISSYTFQSGDTVYTPATKNDMYYVDVCDINPQNLDQAVVLTVNDTLSVSYSPLNYIVRMYNSEDSADALKDLLQAMYDYHLEAKYYHSVVPVGSLQSSGNGWSSSVIYATMAENDAYYEHDNWGIEYTPVNADVIKLVRGGVTTSVGMPGQGTLIKFTATDYCLKTESWTIGGDVLPLVDQDYLIVEGRFQHPATGSVMYISKSYIYNNNGTLEFSTTEPTLPVSYDVGVLQAHNAGSGGSGIYFSTAEVNDAPWGDWNTYYDSNSIDNIKLIRNGETFSVALTDRNTICKFGQNDYYLRLEDYTIGAYAPFTTDDVFVVEGAFTHKNSKTTLNIAQTYIYHNGASWVLGESLPVVYNAGVLKTHEAGMSGAGIYVRTDANDAPSNGDWSLEYKQTSADNIKLVRNGETVSIGIAGRPLLIKINECDYYVKLENWTIGEYAPITTDDMLIIEGDFSYEAGNATLNITKSYIYYDGAAWVCSAEEPVPEPDETVVSGGNLSEHADGWDAAGEIFTSLAENELPVDENAEVEYAAQAGAIKLVRGENTLDLTGTIVKYGATDYYMVLDGDALPLQNNDYLIVEGDFVNESNSYTLNIAKTYILVDGENLVYSLTVPEIVNRYPVTGLTNNSNGWTATGIYISHNAHEATYNGDWSVEYMPVSEDAIKLVRNGETFSVAAPGNNTLVVYSATEMYLKLESWTISGDKLPLVDGDKLIIEGEFKHDTDVLVIEETVIEVVNGGFGINAVSVGALGNHDGGAGGDGVHATMAENSAPYNADWSLEYAPLSADAYRVIRDGVESNIGQVGRGTLVKFSATEGYLKTSGWCMDTFVPQTTDVLIIEGFWKHTAGSTVIRIDKTYLYHNGNTWVFATSLPTVYNAGVLQTHEIGMSGNGMYVRTAACDAPSNGDWSLEYTQTSVDNIKVIRGEETLSIGIAGRPLLIKINECDYYVKLENWSIGEYAPITTDDVLIIEGDFFYGAENVTLNITKSYIYYDGAAWVCSAEEPVSVPSAGVLTAHTAGGSGTGFHAIGAENDAPYDWAAEYAPTSKECIQIIRNGQTIYRNNTGAGAIIKFSANEYYVKFDTWIDSENYPLQAGDIIIIDGIFVGTSNYADAQGVQLKIDKTFVTYNGSSFTFSTEDPRVINVGAMYAQGGTDWNGNVGINFAVDANAVPFNSDWSVEYVPTASENIKLIRNGETRNIANTGAGTIIKLSESNCYLKLEQWMIGDVYPITEGDVLVVEGGFKNANNGYTMVIEKTYIVIGSVANDEVTYTTQYAETDFGAVALPTSTKKVNIGMWNGSHHVFEHKQLQELKDAGITKIMGVNTQWIGADDVNAWLDRVYSYGISVIMDLRDWDGTTVPSYANHPGLIGFLMYDEPSTTVFDDLAALKAKFDAVMPADKLFYVNLFPECAANSSLGTESSWWESIFGDEKDYDTDYVTAFLNKLDIEVLSWDNYPLITNAANQEGIRPEYFHNFEVMAGKGLPLWYTMLSAGHTAGATDTYYATPTAEDLRWQMAVAMTYGVQNIDHYVYASHEDGYSCMVEYEDADGDGVYWETTNLYNDVKTVDNEILAWDNIYTAYNWQGVGAYDTGSTNTMLSTLENKLNLANYGLTVSSSTQDLLVGVFDHNGSKAYMVTNAGSMGSTTVGDGKNFSMADSTVTLNVGTGYKCVAVIDEGVISYVAVNNGTVTLNVEAYEGVFVIPVQ